MSDQGDGQHVEQRSRIKVVMNAKHEPQWEVSVVEGFDQHELDRLRAAAVEQHQTLERELIRGTDA